jgi:hypothetical protein
VVFCWVEGATLWWEGGHFGVKDVLLWCEMNEDLMRDEDVMRDEDRIRDFCTRDEVEV